MKPMHLFVIQEDREAEIVRLMAMGLIALGRLWKSLPPDWEPADIPPDVTKPKDPAPAGCAHAGRNRSGTMKRAFRKRVGRR